MFTVFVDVIFGILASFLHLIRLDHLKILRDWLIIDWLLNKFLVALHLLSFDHLVGDVLLLVHVGLAPRLVVLLSSVLLHLLLGFFSIGLALGVNLVFGGVVILVGLVNHALLIGFFFLALDTWLLIKVVLLF